MPFRLHIDRLYGEFCIGFKISKRDMGGTGEEALTFDVYIGTIRIFICPKAQGMYIFGKSYNRQIDK